MGDQELKNAFLNIAYNSEFSRRSLVKGIFAVAGAAVLFGMPVSARAASAKKETLDALSDAQSQYDAVQAQLNDISSQYEALSEQVNQTLQDIEDTQNQIDELQGQIDEKQKELEGKQSELSDRATASYKSGGNDPLSLLLSSTSLDELISNFYYIDKLNENDQQAIAEIQDIQKELSAQQDELDAKMDGLQTLKEQQQQQMSDMQAKQTEAQDLLTNLDSQVQQLMAQRDAEILESAKAEAAAAEEARRQQAAQSSGGGGSYVPEGGSGQGYDSSASAQQRVVNACYSTPSPGAGYCAMWVSRVFQRAGFGYIGGNACDMYASYCTYSSKSNLQVGMIVAVSTHNHTSAGRIYGHVGIYIGDNKVMENIGYINTNNIDSWCSYYGTTVTPRWGWAGGINLAAQ